MKKIVLSGATGAIGMALIHKCIEAAVCVVILIRKDSAKKDQIPLHPLITIIECELSEYSSHFDEKLIQKIGVCDVFYHLAWMGTFGDSRNDMQLQNLNVRYTLDAVKLARRLGCHTFIGAGSQAEFGRYEGKLNSSIPTNPENGYGIAKLCAGQMSRIYCNQLGMKHIWTRILSVYGPYDPEYTMIMSTINQLIRGNSPKFTKAEQKWDYLYSSDAARALLLLGDKGRDGQTYCIGSGQAKPLIKYIENIRDIVSPEVTLCIGGIPYSPQQVMYLCADIAELQHDTGFEPKVNFTDGIKKTVEWVKNRTE